MTPSLTARLRCARTADRGPDFGVGRSTPNDSLELPPAEVHVWRVDLKRDEQAFPALLQTLAPHELAKAGQLRRVRDRSRYLLTHAAARSILARYLNAAPSDLVFRYGPRGKPELACGAMYFNISRSHDLAIIAISRWAAIGVDIERVSDGVDEEVARCFSSRAHHLLRRLPKGARREAFFRAWTRMEAYAKARGEGLEPSLDALDRFLDPPYGRVLQPAHAAARGWWLHDFSPRSGYVGALAVAEGECSLRYWQWQVDDIGSAKHGESAAARADLELNCEDEEVGDGNFPAATQWARLP